MHAGQPTLCRTRFGDGRLFLRSLGRGVAGVTAQHTGKERVKWQMDRHRHTPGRIDGHTATGKRVGVPGINIVRFEAGKIVEEWTNWDTLGMLQQLGAIPPLGG
jgi:hypothetical protein